MVLGIGEGDIGIRTDKQGYAPGEVIKGEVTLTLKVPKKARELRVIFYGEVTETHHERDSRGRSQSHSSTKRIYEQRLNLSGEQEYPPGTKTYPFELPIPTMPARPQAGEGVGGMIVGVVGAILDPLANAKWYVDASLNMAMSLDISKRIRINILR